MEKEHHVIVTQSRGGGSSASGRRNEFSVENSNVESEKVIYVPAEILRIILLYGIKKDRAVRTYLQLSGCKKNKFKYLYTKEESGSPTSSETFALTENENKRDVSEEKKIKKDFATEYTEEEQFLILLSLLTKKHPRALGYPAVYHFRQISVVLDSKCPDIALRLHAISALSELLRLDIDAFFHFYRGWGRENGAAKRNEPLYDNVFVNFEALFFQLHLLRSTKIPLNKPERDERLERFLSQESDPEEREVDYTAPFPWPKLQVLQLGNVMFAYLQEHDASDENELKRIASRFDVNGTPAPTADKKIGPLKSMGSFQSSIEGMSLYWIGGPVVRYGSAAIYARDQTREDRAAPDIDEVQTHVENDLGWLAFLPAIKLLMVCYYVLPVDIASLLYESSLTWTGLHGRKAANHGEQGALQIYEHDYEPGIVEPTAASVAYMTLRMPDFMESVEELIVAGHDFARTLFQDNVATRFRYPKLRKLVLISTQPLVLNFFLAQLDVAPRLEHVWYYDQCKYAQLGVPVQPEPISVVLNLGNILPQNCRFTLVVPFAGVRKYENVTYSVSSNMTDFDNFYEEVQGLIPSDVRREMPAHQVTMPDFSSDAIEQFRLQEIHYGIPYKDIFEYERKDT